MNEIIGKPELTVARVCQNCMYFTRIAMQQTPGNGECSLLKVTDPNASPFPVHATLTCSFHVWKSKGTGVQKVVLKYNAKPPEDIL